VDTSLAYESKLLYEIDLHRMQSLHQYKLLISGIEIRELMHGYWRQKIKIQRV
jgi:hypothetical protein